MDGNIPTPQEYSDDNSTLVPIYPAVSALRNPFEDRRPRLGQARFGWVQDRSTFDIIQFGHAGGGAYRIPTEGTEMPKVEIPTVMRVASALVAFFCLFSWVLWKLSGFYIIDPFFSILLTAIAALFYVEGVWLEKLWKRK